MHRWAITIEDGCNQNKLMMGILQQATPEVVLENCDTEITKLGLRKKNAY